MFRSVYDYAKKCLRKETEQERLIKCLCRKYKQKQTTSWIGSNVESDRKAIFQNGVYRR